MEFVCICMHYFAYFIYLCMYLLWLLGVLGDFVLFILILFACLLMILTQSMSNWSIRWDKSPFCLSHVNPKPYWTMTYSPDLVLVSPFVGFGFAFHGPVCRGVVTSDEIQFSLSSHTKWLNWASWLCWMGVAWLLSPTCHYLIYYYYFPLLSYCLL